MLQEKQTITFAERLFVGRDRAAELIDVSSRFIDRAIRANDLLAFRVGKRVLIKTSDLVAWVGRDRA